MTLSQSILDQCGRRADLSPEQVDLLTRDQNKLTTEDRARLDRELGPHYDVFRAVISEMYATGKRENLHNVHAWAATIIAESNTRGYMTEFDQFVLRTLNDPSFDAGEGERVNKRFMFASEWIVISRAAGLIVLGLLLVLSMKFSYPVAIFLSVLAMLAVLVLTYFYYSENAAGKLGILAGTPGQVILGLAFLVISYWREKGNIETIIWLLAGYAVLFFGHGLAIPLLAKLAERWGKEPSTPFQSS